MLARVSRRPVSQTRSFSFTPARFGGQRATTTLVDTMDEATVKKFAKADGAMEPYGEVMATGAERAERQFGSAALFPDEYPRFIAPTDKFILVPTFEEERVVGCAGLCAENVPARFKYWTMEPGQKGVCTECGRKFYCYNPELEYEAQEKLEQDLATKGVSLERYHLMKLTEERQAFEKLCSENNIPLPDPSKKLPDIGKFSEEDVVSTLKSIYNVQEEELKRIVADTALVLQTLGDDKPTLLIQ